MVPYGEAVGLGVDRLAFSLSLAAFAVAWCRRSESDFSLSASGVLCGLTVVLSSEREQPAAANTLRTRRRRKKFFMISESVEMGDCLRRRHCYSAAPLSAISKTKAPHRNCAALKQF